MPLRNLAAKRKSMTISSYPETLEYLYKNLPMYHRVGAVAYKADLTNIIALCNALGNPERKFKSVHVGGTNGKGSSSHMLASILQAAGYKTGLFTSPHLKEFTERIRVNGEEADKDFVVTFVNRMIPLIEKLSPSFFEITVAMAYSYFVWKEVDIAVIEVGLGGRLDSTNIIDPEVSLITNIGWDHMNILGDSLEKIAFEKAGIIKQGRPVIISQTQTEVQKVFTQQAASKEAPIIFADQLFSAKIINTVLEVLRNGTPELKVEPFPLPGVYQEVNVPGVMMCVDVLNSKGWSINQSDVARGLRGVVALTSLKGRWQQLESQPTIICDTGHNEDGIRQILLQLTREKFKRLFMVMGMVNDKRLDSVLSILPKEANYYFCEAKLPRALPAEELEQQAAVYGLNGVVVKDVNMAIAEAKKSANREDFIFVGGSTFVVAEIEGL